MPIRNVIEERFQAMREEVSLLRGLACAAMAISVVAMAIPIITGILILQRIDKLEDFNTPATIEQTNAPNEKQN